MFNMHTFTELREIAKEELISLLHNAKKELVQLQILTKTGQNKAVHKIKELKKYISRVLTALNNKI